MRKQDLFIKYHWTSAIILLIVIVSSVGFNVIVQDTDWLSRRQGEVKGQYAVGPEVNLKNQKLGEIKRYQAQLKNIVHNYLQQRIKFETENKDWLFLINNTKYKLISLPVPDAYRRLHLSLVTILDLEKKAVTIGDREKLDKANHRWEKILKQYYWID